MSVALLDVNVLIAMSWVEHVHNLVTREWFIRNRAQGWATCPLTQAAFVRLSIQPPVVGARVNMAQAMEALEDHCRDPFHQFFPQSMGWGDLLPEIRERMVGHQQLTDAILLDLAIRNGGRLVTLDRRIQGLLPAGSPHQAALEIIPAE